MCRPFGERGKQHCTVAAKVQIAGILAQLGAFNLPVVGLGQGVSLELSAITERSDRIGRSGRARGVSGCRPSTWTRPTSSGPATPLLLFPPCGPVRERESRSDTKLAPVVATDNQPGPKADRAGVSLGYGHHSID